MREVTTGRVRRQAPLFAALVLSLLSIPLLAPTCSQSSAGLRTFSKKSIIIPMDACYQGDGTTTPVACPGSADNGRLLYGYGLVYRLLQEGVTVYWVIAPNKTSLTDVDLTVQFNAGAPVGKYNWTNGTFASRPPNNSTAIANYRGGPFVIDGAEFDKANALLQGALKSTFSQVNLHVTNVAFSGYVARAMNGGWTAGGTQPPPIALLNITGGDCKNSLSTVTQYLKDAGLGNVPNAAGTAAGPHGAIYDVLDYADFLPNLSGSRLGQNGYRVLWAPHWVGRNSCTRTCVQGSSGPVCNSLIPATSVDNIRTTIRQFVAAGGDLFSECSSIGAVEGDANHCDTASIVQNSAAGRIATTGGLSINQYGWDFQCPGSKGARFYYPQFAPLQFTQYSSPLLQIAEFPFSANSGAIGNYQPMAGSAWTSNVQHLITDTTGAWDVFTVKPTVNGSGTTVYLAGHDYSTIGNPYQLSGSRMVLNTLFNLGAGCVTTNADCQTGKLGECGKGKMQCVNGAPTCVQVNQPAAETCDNKDNDCNGLVDDGLAQACYTGPSATRNVGACRAGTSTCTAGVWSSCQGQVLPTAELCNGIDDDCEGRIDNGVAPRACYGGPVGTSGLGECKSGTQACQSGTWGTCSGEVRPVAEVCSDGKDNNCDGAVDEGCGCLTGQVQPCYAGPNGTVGVGICKRGTQTCTAGAWGRCTGEQLPQTEVCNGLDDDCDGQTDEDGVCDECSHGQTRSCYTGPPGTQNVGACRAGAQECVNGKWGGCNGQVLPGPELCDGKDNDCDGELDDQAPCPDKLACINGVCVPPKCTGELARCPEGYACRTGGCAPVVCGTAVCPAGTRCLNGVCSDPCDGVRCGQGAICAGGVCSGGGCYATGCPQGQLCRDGSCAPDSCSGQTCPAGAFCRDGYCVQSCAFVSCPTGQRCGPDGLCIPDPCHDVVCTAGETCEAGVCKPNPCANLGCGARQVCHGGACVDDPCNEVQCPVGTCVNGQCYGGLLPADGGTDGADGGTGGGEDAGTGGEDGADAGAPNAPVDEGPLAPAAPPATGCGCAASSGGDGAALLGALFAVAALRRRRVGAAAAAALLASCAADLPPSQLSGEGGYCEYQSECSPGLTCRGNVCRAPRADAGPVEEPDWLVDNRPKCERCGGEECVDLLVNPAHCGACGTVCGASEKCVDGHCGPADFIGPALSAVAPGTVSQAPQVALQLTGERFKQGAKLHLAGRGLSDLPTQFVSSSRLDVTLDLSDVAPGVMELRVVNPDRVISNASTLEITAATPRITSLSPAQGVTGSSVKVRVQGSGFIRQSLCKVSGAKLPEQGLPTQYQSPSALDCTFDLSGVQPGAYDITVVNAGTLRSNASTFTVISADPVLTTISPGSGKPGAKLSVTATGTGFDATSVLRFNGSPLPTTLVSGTQLFATPLDLTNVAPGNYPVTVANGSKLSNAVTFAVGSNPAELTSISPTHAIQGQSVALTVIGRGFESGSRIQVFDPGGASTLLTTTFVSATELRGTYALGSRPAGTYLVQVQNPGNLASNALPLQVASNVAVLSSLTPAGAAQGANVTLEVSGSNFLSGARIWIGGNGRTNSALTTTVVSSGLVRASNVSLAGWNTGTYSVTVVNTGAQPSNAAGFTVFAGAPTISSLNPSSATQGQVVTVTINGTNFARPDSGGAGGSEVHAAAPSLGLTDSTVDATVVSATQITVVLDTTTVPAGTYQVSVWNPGGNPPPQKSNTVTFTVNP